MMQLLSIWKKLHKKPLGPWLFGKMVAYKVPYTGSMKSTVSMLEPGRAEVLLKDRRRVRNHLDCIHAIAQMNLAEFCSGLAMLTLLGPKTRGIVTQLSMTYHKKARGTLTAKSVCEPFELTGPKEITVKAQIFDMDGDLVSEAQAFWKVSPK